MRGNHRKVTRRHAAPASRSRRIVRTAAVAVAIAGGLAGYGLSGAHAATVHHATRRQIMAACKRGASMGIDRHTYVCVQRAPEVACEQVFSVRGCFWYTGTRDQILWTRTGLVATEGP
jgi:hypothetical protein